MKEDLLNFKKQKLIENSVKESNISSEMNEGNNTVTPTTATASNNLSVIPSYKEKKYDRQLRLWASSGQQALENSHVLLIGATATGCELVKNLILPGIGQVTILDGSLVNDEDIKSNFFLNGGSDLGKPKAECVSKLLNELNPQMTCKFLLDDELLNFTQFNLVIASGIGPKKLLTIQSQLMPLRIPLIIADAIGFYGYLRLCLSHDHFVVESHPDSLVDLRLDAPWPELVEYSQKFENLEKFDNAEIEHIPFVVLLINSLKKWKQLHGQVPTTYEEKKEFKTFIMESARKGRNNTITANADYENFEEAVGSVWKLFQSSQTLSPSLQEIIYHENISIKKNNSQFWTVVAALHIFYEQKDANGNPRKLLPLSGVLPDMKSSTEWFVELQTIYKQKAEEDFSEIKAIIKSLQTKAGTLSDEYIRTFCKNSRYIRRFHGGDYVEYFATLRENSHIQPDDFNIYLAIRAYKSFQERTGHRPGINSVNDDLTSDIKTVLSRFNTPTDIEPAIKIAKELTRAAGELYNIASFIGGVGAQEAVKIITHQYTPLNNTLIYDGILSRTGSFRI